MDGFSSSLMKLWKEWNVRVTVLLSFTLQVVLIVLGNRRKHDSRFWIRIVTWCAYLSADFVATYALGVITNNMLHFHEKNVGSVDANSELTAFWAPFLLMHLGGPDTITAYSLEDNELWLRHLLGLVVQLVMAIYVSVMAWTGSLLSFLSPLMLFVGLIKYGERTWVLRKASLEKIRDSYADLNLSHASGKMEEIDRMDSKNSPGYNLYVAYSLMNFLFQPLLLDLNQSSAFMASKDSSRSFAVDEFQMIEMSLAFMYNNLYTKALLLYTHVGLGLRVITVFLTSFMSVIFPVLLHKHKFSKIDVTITFILLYGGIILEIYSALLLLFSDRFQLWLIEHPKCSMFEAFKAVVLKKKRWSNKMSQFSLLSFSAKEKPLTCLNFLKHFSIVQNFENQRSVADIEIHNDLKELILTYLKTKRDQTAPSDSEIPNYLHGMDLSEIPDDLKKLILTYLETKRDQTAPSESLNIHVPGIEFTEELEKSILAWHVATEIWYEMDREHLNGKGHVIELICQISKYMFSLLVLHPNMVSNAHTAKFILQPILVAARRLSFESSIEACQKFREWLECTVSEIEDETKNLSGYSESIHDFYDTDLPNFLEQLEQKHWQERWVIICCTWLEMLLYAACKCRGLQHAQRLKYGGEFLTHIWFVTKYFGFTENNFTSHVPRWARSIIDFGDASSRRSDLVGINESDISCSEI